MYCPSLEGAVTQSLSDASRPLLCNVKEDIKAYRKKVLQASFLLLILPSCKLRISSGFIQVRQLVRQSAEEAYD